MSIKKCEWCGRTYDGGIGKSKIFNRGDGRMIFVCSPKCRKEAIIEWGEETEEHKKERLENSTGCIPMIFWLIVFFFLFIKCSSP